jgi:hypothetical protein
MNMSTYTVINLRDLLPRHPNNNNNDNDNDQQKD